MSLAKIKLQILNQKCKSIKSELRAINRYQVYIVSLFNKTVFRPLLNKII